MAAGKGWSESVVEVAGAKIHLARAGSGRPVLVLHHDIGSPDRLPFYDELAGHFDVLIPHHPGYGKSERPQWLRNVRDVAVIYQWLLSDTRAVEIGTTVYCHAACIRYRISTSLKHRGQRRSR